MPAFYTYEEMHHGDMELFVRTPWEEQAFVPLKRDLNYIGKNMPENVFIHWCGTNVRSRKIAEEELKEWTNNLSGRVPFLWDNTIYSHYPFTSSSMFTSYENKFPENLHLKTAGNGMFVNGDVCLEVNRASMMTVNDFLWNSSVYYPKASLNNSIELLYGVENVDNILEYKNVELEIREKIGERELWYQADSLWKWIRKTRYTTEKNPFYYHLNYSRLKALRLQLKSSVPEPLPIEEFEQLMNDLVFKRKEIINNIQSNQNLSNALRQYSVKFDVNKITK
ncbi:MAG: beta-N-acetylglucosaminidase domain-containing protein [Ignavibacterium sp.]|nr:MAG: beta-N-acetylglucosaminidase domain-containing protein [Ignavibacterium sp.]